MKAVLRCLIVLFAALLLTGCLGQPVVNGVPEPRAVPNGDAAAGRRLIAQFGCGACHSIPGVPGADARAAPPLDHFYQRIYIAGKLPNTADNLVKWITDPQQVVPGNAMPDLGVTPDQARDMAAYLYHQPTLADWLGR
ncbi:MAG: c-type cytochrome [Anaerolineae bacterium]